MSLSLRDLIKKMLTRAEKRLTLNEILEHPWVKDTIEKPVQLKLDFNQMKSVTKFSKLKTIVTGFLSAQLPAREIEPLAELFKSIDTNHDGFISVTEMENALKKEGYHPDSKELHAMMKSMDLDKNGKINYNEFIASMVGDEFCQQTDYLEYIFKYFDADKNGKISEKELQLSI